ncbi:MAG: response regulator [Nitrospirae bacterium]|nr:MAG: response regulator [Nitrospirota bacterium]
MTKLKEKEQTILIADDELLVREVLSEMLTAHGYVVDAVSNGLEAYEQYKKNSDYTLIISDMIMPVMSGLDLLKKLREEGSDIPVIILSGSYDVSAAVEAIKSGASDYVLKGQDAEEAVIISIQKALEKQQILRSNKRLVEDLAEKSKQLETFNNVLKITVDKLTKVGASLMSERSLAKLLDMIVRESRDVTNADGGTLYVLEDDLLHFKISQNRSLNIFLGGIDGGPAMFPPLALNENYVSAYAAMKKEIVNIPDVYKSDQFDFTGPKRFDESAGYNTKSMLVLPMIDRQGVVIGVLQLINSIDPDTTEIVEFNESLIAIAQALACQAAVCIENAKSYETIQKKNIAFGRFVPNQFLNFLGKVEVEHVNLGDATEQELSVLFSDIRQFTSISEKLTPEENFRFLNEYLRYIGPVITGNGGFIDKYIGDAIMALFPGIHAGVADDAVIAAIGMRRRLSEYNEERKKSGQASIDIGIGINTGTMTLGTIGFETRMDSTVIGDTVNLASRIEGITKKYGIPIVISEFTIRELRGPGKFHIREIDIVRVKGKEEPITVYEIFDADPEGVKEAKIKNLKAYNEGLSLYRAHRWEDSLKVFSGLDKLLPADDVVRLYSERCRNFIEAPPERSDDLVVRL